MLIDPVYLRKSFCLSELCFKSVFSDAQFTRGFFFGIARRLFGFCERIGHMDVLLLIQLKRTFGDDGLNLIALWSAIR
ncbi:MAG: hypothetical protein AAFQ29_11110, partial [Pseudomonadota bacterium]